MIEILINRTFKIRDSVWKEFIGVCNKNGERHSTILRELIVAYIKRNTNEKA